MREELIDRVKRRFEKVGFDPIAHAYTYDGQPIPGVSSVISKFTPVFKREYWLKRKSEELGVSVEQLSAQWDESRDVGIDRGHTFHTYAEFRLKGIETDNRIEVVDRYLDSIKDESVFEELIMGGPIYGGTLDNLVIRDGELVLKDWKTNRIFDKDSKFKLLSPLNHLPNTRYWKYALQQSLYTKLLDEPVSKIEIVWFHDDTWEVIDIPYLEQEVDSILNKLMEWKLANIFLQSGG